MIIIVSYYREFIGFDVDAFVGQECLCSLFAALSRNRENLVHNYFYNFITQVI